MKRTWLLFIFVVFSLIFTGSKAHAQGVGGERRKIGTIPESGGVRPLFHEGVISLAGESTIVTDGDDLYFAGIYTEFVADPEKSGTKPVQNEKQSHWVLPFFINAALGDSGGSAEGIASIEWRPEDIAEGTSVRLLGGGGAEVNYDTRDITLPDGSIDEGPETTITPMIYGRVILNFYQKFIYISMSGANYFNTRWEVGGEAERNAGRDSLYLFVSGKMSLHDKSERDNNATYYRVLGRIGYILPDPWGSWSITPYFSLGRSEYREDFFTATTPIIAGGGLMGEKGSWSWLIEANYANQDDEDRAGETDVAYQPEAYLFRFGMSYNF